MSIKQGQLAGEAIKYILAIIIVSFIFFFGYNIIKDFLAKEEKIESINAQNMLKSDVKQLSDDYGTVKIKSYDLPPNVNQVCFYDENNRNNPLLCRGCPKSSDFPLVADQIRSGTGMNVFFTTDGAPDSIDLDEIDIGCCEFKCFDALNNKLNIKLSSKGNKTFIEAVK